MEIKTTYAIGEKVWAIYNHKAKAAKIVAFIISRNCVEYSLRTSEGEFFTENELFCFATKEELIAYITNDGN